MTAQPNPLTAAASNIPISADYTSRDYYALREELLTRLSERVPEWVGQDPADFGVALVEAFAFMGDITNYYIDRIANENFILTATQRQSILELAATLGYTPTGYRAATTTVQFSNTSDASITIPEKTQLLIDVVCEDEVKQLFFTTTSEITIAANDVESVTAINGEWASSRVENAAIDDMDVSAEWVGTSNGLPNQTFQLLENQVVEGTVSVYVKNGDVYEKWTETTNLTEANPNDAVYSLSMDADNFVYVTFGDGVSGAIPANGETIKVDYLIGGGVLGNITSGIADGIHFAPGLTTTELATLDSDLVITYSDGFGGAEPESNDNIRYAAPKYFTAQGRAVTLNDYANLALGVSEVGKAKAVAASPNAVTIFVGKDPDPTDPFQFPGYDADPADGGVVDSTWTNLKEDVLNFFEGKTQIGTTITVAPPAYPHAGITVQYTKLPQFSYEQVVTNIKQAILTRYGYSNSDFAEIITPEDVEYVLRQVNGVVSAQVKELYRSVDTPARNILVGDVNEIFVFVEADMMILAADALSGIGLSAGTLNPVFKSSVPNYTVALPNGTTTVDVTPAAESSTTATITVNGTVVASGDPVTVSTPVGVTTVNVIVTAEDGVTTRTYTVTFTRSS